MLNKECFYDDSPPHASDAFKTDSAPFSPHAFFLLVQPNHVCSVDLCFCTSGDGIDGSRRCFLEYVDSLHTTRIIILTGWRERRDKRESERLVRVPVSYRGM